MAAGKGLTYNTVFYEELFGDNRGWCWCKGESPSATAETNFYVGGPSNVGSK